MSEPPPAVTADTLNARTVYITQTGKRARWQCCRPGGGHVFQYVRPYDIPREREYFELSDAQLKYLRIEIDPPKWS